MPRRSKRRTDLTQQLLLLDELSAALGGFERLFREVKEDAYRAVDIAPENGRHRWRECDRYDRAVRLLNTVDLYADRMRSDINLARRELGKISLARTAIEVERLMRRK
jgi:acyl-CoA reductase-like NAD-dependent aldehyde dehydrogenase